MCEHPEAASDILCRMPRLGSEVGAFRGLPQRGSVPNRSDENSVPGSSDSDPPRPADGVLEPAAVGRYLVFDEIGVGGMASVHLGLLTGAVGFRRIVAVKQLHSKFVHDPDFVAQFINEARLAARIHHTNVVQTLDVVWTGTQLLLVMDYVDGDTLNRVLRSAAQSGVQVPLDVACSMLTGVLHGLHAAHEARDEEGVPLNIVHRDVSPQNILIARDGVARVLDFGVAKAAAQGHHTETGLIKGKFGYMAPEQIMRSQVDRRTDVFAAGVVLWETLTRRRLFQSSKNIEKALSRVVSGEIIKPSTYRPDIPPELDAIVMRAIDREPETRFQSAEEFAVAVESSVAVASPHLVKTWFDPIASSELAHRAELIRNINKRYANPGRAVTPRPGEIPAQFNQLNPMQQSSHVVGSPRDEETRQVMLRESAGEVSSSVSGEVLASVPADVAVATPRRVVGWPEGVAESPPPTKRSLSSEIAPPPTPLERSPTEVPFEGRSRQNRVLSFAVLGVLAVVAALAVALITRDDSGEDLPLAEPSPAAAQPVEPRAPASTEPPAEPPSALPTIDPSLDPGVEPPSALNPAPPAAPKRSGPVERHRRRAPESRPPAARKNGDRPAPGDRDLGLRPHR